MMTSMMARAGSCRCAPDRIEKAGSLSRSVNPQGPPHLKPQPICKIPPRICLTSAPGAPIVIRRAGNWYRRHPHLELRRSQDAFLSKGNEDMGANELSSLLWHERELLDLLIFKLEEEQLLLTAGKTKWLQHATREVEQVVQKLREAGLARTVEASRVAVEWGAKENASLSELAAAAPAGPWGELLRSHLEAMSSQTAQIRQLRDANEQFLRAAARSAQETASALQPETGIYDAAGHTNADNGPAAGGHLFDTNL